MFVDVARYGEVACVRRVIYSFVCPGCFYVQSYRPGVLLSDVVALLPGPAISSRPLIGVRRSMDSSRPGADRPTGGLDQLNVVCLCTALYSPSGVAVVSVPIESSRYI